MLSRYNPPMPEALTYAAPPPWYRRRHWLCFVMLLILIVGYTLALPQYRALHRHQVRRSEIRKQFTTEVTAARQALDGGQLETAALALLHAQFPIRTEQGLFWESELDRCEQAMKPLRARLLVLSAKVRAKSELREAEEKVSLKKKNEEERRQGIHMIRCYFPRVGVVAALHVRAGEQLQAHNMMSALAICDQIVVLEPDHVFDDNFWGNARVN
jgi:multidrug resistance efflux pump